MTNEEAIKTIKTAIADVEWNYPMDYAVAFEIAISALEKQIPKKPIYLSRRYWETVSSGRCPNCKAQVNSMTYRYCKHSDRL